MRNEQDAARAIELYAAMVRRISFLYLKNHADTEDIFQTVFLKYVLYSGLFESTEHERAWFARVTVNACKDQLRSFFRRYSAPLEDADAVAINVDSRDGELMEVVLSLPERYKTVIYLAYYEGYTASEIGGILRRSENTIYTWLSRGKKLLRAELGGDALG